MSNGLRIASLDLECCARERVGLGRFGLECVDRQRSILGVVLLLAAMATPVPAELAGNWDQVTDEQDMVGHAGIGHTVWRSVRPPGGEYDQVALHRYRSIGAPSQAALLFLPGTHMAGEMDLEEDHHLLVYLARRGVEVFALDYRTRKAANEELEDQSFLRLWTVGRFVGDARHAAWLARWKSGHQRVFVAGFSRGAAFAYAVALAESESVAGVIALDGYFKHHAPKPERGKASVDARRGEAPEESGEGPATADESEESQGSAEQRFDRRRAELEDSGRWASDVSGSLGWSTRHQLMTRVAEDPGQQPLRGEGHLANSERFADAGEQLAHILHHAWGPGRLSNTRDSHSEPQVLARLLAGYDRYYPRVQDLEGEAMASVLDYPRSNLDDNLGEARVPVLFFGSTGMGLDFLLSGLHSAHLLAGTEAEVHVLEGWGHLDVLVGEKAKDAVYEPMLRWMLERSPESERP